MGYEIDFLPVDAGERSGDAIALRFGNLQPDYLNQWVTDQTVVVVDGGYQDAGTMLAGHIQKYYGTDYADLVISTHPDANHVNGLKVILEQMRVGELFLHRPWLHAAEVARIIGQGFSEARVRETLRRSLEGARELESLAIAKVIPITEPFTGITRFNGQLRVVGPSLAYYESLLPLFRGMPAAAGAAVREALLRRLAELVTRVAESFNVETLDDTGETTAENNSGVILHLALDGDRLLLTADTGIPALTQAADHMDAVGISGAPLSFVQVPHHGSKRNVGPTILDRLLGPKNMQASGSSTAFVSASAEGAPKHPAKKVVNAFTRRGAKVVVTRGRSICHYSGTSGHPDWVPAAPEPLYDEVEE